MPHPVLIAASLPEPAMEEARRRFDARIETQLATDVNQVSAVAGEIGARAIIIGSRSKLGAPFFETLPKSVQVVATASVGYDHIDLVAAKAAGVTITNTPDVLTNATADITLFLMLGALRRGKEYLAVMEEGWRRPIGFDELLGMEVGARTLGVVGMGRIGQAVAKRAKAFGMPIAYHNRNRLTAELEQGATYYDSLEGLLPHAQVLCLTAPSSSGGPMITAERIALLPKGAVLVNTGRGPLVDDDAVIAALRSGQLAAAGLDVFTGEPAYDLRYRDLPNVFYTPHMGSATVETRTAMGLRSLDNVGAVLDGREPGDKVV